MEDPVVFMDKAQQSRSFVNAEIIDWRLSNAPLDTSRIVRMQNSAGNSQWMIDRVECGSLRQHRDLGPPGSVVMQTAGSYKGGGSHENGDLRIHGTITLNVLK